MTTGQRIFTRADQEAFAQLSGDYNPLHMDELASRRLLFGETVVHGIHSLLWILDQWCTGPFQLKRIAAVFRNPIRLGQNASWTLKSPPSPGTARFLLPGGTLRIDFEPGPRLAPVPAAAPFPPTLAEVWTMQNIATASGRLPLHLNPALAAKMFPRLSQQLPPAQLAALLACTNIIGMRCPGLHSVFSELDLRFHTEASPNPAIAYNVESFDERFNLAVIAIEGASLTGTLTAFLRHPPQNQLDFSTIASHVTPAEFAGQRALVVGGSRGLGEVIAKLLAAGGAELLITYNRGSADAQRLAAEIRQAGGTAECLQFDVLHPVLPESCTPTHLYYLATPFIFKAVAGSFSEALFQEFCQYYVTAFQKIVTSLLPGGLKKVLYPSSSALDELPINMAEYSAAKMAGESMAAFLARHHQLTIRSPRLPRLATDQTTSLIPVENKDPVPVMLAELRALK